MSHMKFKYGQLLCEVPSMRPKRLEVIVEGVDCPKCLRLMAPKCQYLVFHGEGQYSAFTGSQDQCQKPASQDITNPKTGLEVKTCRSHKKYLQGRLDQGMGIANDWFVGRS